MARAKEKTLDADQVEIGELQEPATQEATTLIAVTQLPIITERLRDVKAQVEQTVKEAKSMVATADTVQAVENRRAELNKQFKMLEDQRKAVKAQIMAPYDSFNAVYKECIEIPFKEADQSLKATVDGYRAELKDVVRKNLEIYYAELCESLGVNFLPFDRALLAGKITINMTDTKSKTPRRLMDALAETVSKVALGMEQIRQMEDSAEIMAEYKVCLDVGKSVANVQGRKRLIQAEKEAEAKRKEEADRRAEMIARVEAAARPQAPVPVAAPGAPAAPPERIYPEFKFTVFNCTKAQLLKLRDFMKAEGIQYGR